jgi:hypothetical protein
MNCGANYVTSGSFTCACGVLTTSDLKCRPKPEASDFCSDAYPQIPNGGAGDCVAGAASGTSCTPKCNAGYEEDGKGVCQSDGTWGMFSCRLPETESGIVFVRISNYATTDCTGEKVTTQELKQCRCRGNECQQITCEPNGDYRTASYFEAECKGDPKAIMVVKAGSKNDIIQFGTCQVSIGRTESSKLMRFFYF